MMANKRHNRGGPVPLARNRTLSLVLQHSRSCNAPDCLTCKKLPELLEAHSVPLSLNAPVVPPQWTTSRQLIDIYRVVHYRGSRASRC